MSVKIFLSTVSDEFGDYRDQLRSDLTRHNVEVKIQEDFKDYGGVTLDKLDLYIRTCDAVVHLVGNMTGAYAEPESTNWIKATYPDITTKLPPLCDPLAKGLGISYTQWEAWLALYHNKRLLIAKADDTAPRSQSYAPNSLSRAAQRDHLKRLSEVGRYPDGTAFTSPDNLAKKITLTTILDLIAINRSNETIDRHKRKVLLGAAALGTVAAADIIVPTFWPEAVERALRSIRSFYEPDHDLLQSMQQPDPQNVELIKRIIGVRSNRTVKLAGGRDHYLHPGQMHHDCNWASHSFIKVLQTLGQDFERDPAGDFNLSGSFVCCGSPTANLRTAAFMEYEWVDPRNAELGFRRKHKSLLKLPIQYELNTKLLAERGLLGKTTVDRKATPEWAITLNGTLKKTIAGEKDFLLISRLPNLFEAQMSPTSETENIVTIFGGCHGSGTGALRLLLNNRDLLRKLDALTDQHPYWQALIEISEIESRIHPVKKDMRYQATSLGSRLAATERVTF
jgi:hypothetical protein